MCLPIALPLDIEVDPQLIVIAILAVIYGIAAVVNGIRNVAKRARERLERAALGEPPIPPRPIRPAVPGRPVTVSQAAPPAPPPSAQPAPGPPAGRDLMADLETILRDQLGLDLRPKTAKPEGTPGAPAQPAPGERRTIESGRSVIAPPPRPASAPPMVRPAVPVQPARPAVPPPAVAVPAEAVPVVAGAPAARAPMQPAGAQLTRAREALTQRGEQRGARAYDQRQARGTVSAQSHQVRAGLRGKRLREAIILREILGPPRADASWTAGPLGH